MKSILLLLTAGIVATQPAPSRGLRIVIRETRAAEMPGAFVSEKIEYRQGGRRREDFRIVAKRESLPDGPLVRREHPTSVLITRCDLQRYVSLNPQERTYSSHPLEWRPGALQEWLVRMTYRKSGPPRTPNLLIETTTVDTGERKHAFGRVARHVITTRKEIPLPSRGVAHDATITDGWYIDLDPELACEPRRTRHAYLVGGVVSRRGVVGNSGETPLPVVTFKDVGTPEEGYPIELRRTYRSGDRQPHGAATPMSLTDETIVTEFSTEPLDPRLFEIPKGFRPAEGRFAAIAGDLNRTWYLLKGVVASYF